MLRLMSNVELYISAVALHAHLEKVTIISLAKTEPQFQDEKESIRMKIMLRPSKRNSDSTTSYSSFVMMSRAVYGRLIDININGNNK